MKRHLYAAVFSVALTALTVFTLLDTFVIPKGEISVPKISGTVQSESETSDSAPIYDSNSYSDDNIQIEITENRVDNTTVYIADIKLSSLEYLKTAFADATYGRNIKASTSDTAEENSAVLAVNGDYYGFRNSGWVLRNGILYRSVSDNSVDALVIDNNGKFSFIDESTQSVPSDGIWQIFSFGPVLVNEGSVAVDKNDEVAKSMTSNPRTAVGMISPLHYLFVVSDGRTSQSEGLSLYSLAQVMQNAGCTEAYNLDGGGSSTMYFMGNVINNPTTNGKSVSEREVSDIVYIG